MIFANGPLQGQIKSLFCTLLLTNFLNLKVDLTDVWKKFCRDDDSKAFEIFYYALINKLIRFCVLRTGQLEIAEEIVSEVFVRCWNNRKKLEDINYPEMYLYSAVKNESLKYRMKSTVHFVDIDDHIRDMNTQLPDGTDPSVYLERKDLKRSLDEAIQTLPLQARTVFLMIKEDGLRYKEVAELLDISPRTVQTHLFRAIEKLRIELRRHHRSAISDNDVHLIGVLLASGISFYFHQLVGIFNI